MGTPQAQVEFEIEKQIDFHIEVGDYDFSISLRIYEDEFVMMDAYAEDRFGFGPCYDDVEFTTPPSFSEIEERIEGLMQAQWEAYEENRITRLWSV